MVVAVASLTHDAAIGRLPEPVAFGAILGLPSSPTEAPRARVPRARIRVVRHDAVMGGVVDFMVTGNAGGQEGRRVLAPRWRRQISPGRTS